MSAGSGESVPRMSRPFFLQEEVVVSAVKGALEMVARTDSGRVRDHNEDAVFVNPDRGFAILADGMGGYNAGEVASGLATTFLSSALETSFFDPSRTKDANSLGAAPCLEQSIALANTAIYKASVGEAAYAGMGTTLVTALFHDDRVTVAHIGDSRLYRLRDEQLALITHDHSLLQEQIDQGLISAKDARFSQNKNLVTRALGVEPSVESEIHEYEVLPGDVYLFCSDGLNDMLPDEEIELALQSLTANLELAADHLIQMANDNGGRDNVSVILVKALRAFPERPDNK